MSESSGQGTSEKNRGIERAHVLAAIVGFVLFFAASAALVPSGGPGVEQPIAFNHRIHTVDNDMACNECHSYYDKEAFSGFPDRETCAFCHEEPQGESAAELALVEILTSGAPLEWQPLFRQPPHVFYSHRRHVQAAGLECESCHGDIGQSEAPPRRVRSLDMDGCIDCHQKEEVTEDCTSCHR